MKRFAIEREVPPLISWEEMDAAGIQNVMNWFADGDVAAAPSLAGVEGARWVRSYWAVGTPWFMCCYEAKDRDTVDRWQEAFQLPYVRVQQIHEEESPVIGEGYPRGFHATAEDCPLMVVEAAVADLTVIAEANPGAWVRSYIDESDPAAVAVGLFRRALLTLADVPGARVHQVVEVEPRDYLGWD